MVLVHTSIRAGSFVGSRMISEAGAWVARWQEGLAARPWTALRHRCREAIRTACSKESDLWGTTAVPLGGFDSTSVQPLCHAIGRGAGFRLLRCMAPPPLRSKLALLTHDDLFPFASNIATGARSDSPMGSATSFSQPKRARHSASRASS